MATRSKKNVKKDPSFRDMKADYYPVQRKVQIGTSSQVANTTGAIVDVGRMLSVVNHRLYRQGKTYQVKIDFDNRTDTTVGANQYDVYVLTDTWYVQKAWQMARANYIQATAAERENMKGYVARWEDFRVTSGVPSGVTGVPYQYSRTLAGAVNTDGEFDVSVVTLADGTTQRTYSWSTAPAASEWSILGEYDKSGNTSASPASVTAGSAYAGSDGDIHQLQAEDLANDGNLPPYNRTDFTDNIWVRVATLDNSGAANPGLVADSRMSTGFFNAPCGLVVIRPRIAHTFEGELSLTVKAGDYKGVAAMNMGA